MVTYTKDGVAVDGIDTAVEGTYIIHYNVSDVAGNKAAEVTRTVIVSEAIDATAPVITLNGDATVYINDGSAYTDAGVTITDDKDTGLTAIVTYTKDGVAVDGIDITVEGTYVIHYNVSDAAGNKAVEVTRTVIVDKTAPVITINGDAAITLIAYSIYNDAGATATDNIDAAVTVTNDIATALDITKAGTYTITYTAKDVAGNTATATRTVIVTDKMSDNWTIVSKTANRMATGATEYTIVSKHPNGDEVWSNTSYFCEADIANNPNIKVLSNYGHYDASKWQLTTLSEQAAAAQAYFDSTEGYENYKVIGILIGDFFNMSTGEPLGSLVMNGTEYHGAGGRPYFAILKDGTPAIRSGNVPLNDCESAVGGAKIILKDGTIDSGLKNSDNQFERIMYSRAAIGIKEDGTVVTMATRGFKIPENYGLNFYEVAQYMKTMGCKDAIMLDCGGSAQWSSMYEGTDELEVRNNPSDGYERSVSSSIMIVSTAAADGKFDHANIAPMGKVYTPNSVISFSAVGVDGASNPADIPDGIVWTLADDSYGTINTEGVFTSNGKVGDVTVQLAYNNNVVGETVITIAGPDTITFTAPEVSVGRGKKSNLGLTVLYNNRPVNYKSGDFIWSLSDPNMGTVNNETNTFTASRDITTTGTITVTSKYDENVSGSILVNVGQDPTVVFDFEDHTAEEGIAVDSFEYWGADDNGRIIGRKTGGNYLVEPTGKLTTLFYNRGGKESADIVRRADGYPVHSGKYALKLNYDMSKATGTEGANLGLTENFYIPGYPTGLGLWVYIPEDTPNLWLRAGLSIVDEDGNVESSTQYDYTEEIKKTFPDRGSYGGLDDVERGTWKLLVCDLSKYAGSRFMMPAGETIRLMWTSSNAPLTSEHNPRTDVTASHGIYLPDGTTISQADCVGSIYIDDFMFIYGSVNEDTKAPIVTSFTANGEKMSDGMKFNTSSINFRAMFIDEDDEENKVKASGIDNDNVYMYIDGQLMNKAVKDNVMIALDGVKLANGEHSVKLLVTDVSGNEKIATYRFVVDADDNTATSVHLITKNTEAVLGSHVDLDIESDEVSNIDSISMTLKIDKKYKGSYRITAGDGYTIDEGSTSYGEIHNTVTFTANRNADAVSSGKGAIATISFEIPSTLAEGSYFPYSVEAGSIIYADGYTEENQPSFSSLKYQLPVVSTYTISSDIIVAGMNEGYFYVKDTDGKAVSNAALYFADGSEIGQTDSDGKVAVPDSIRNTVNEFEVYAKDSDGNVSFSYTGQSYAAGGMADSGVPVYILNNATSDGFTTRNISWMSNPIYSGSVAKIKISDSEANIENGQIYTGISELYTFNGSSNASENYAARINGIKIKDLTPGKTYYYRVGDGTTWSEVDSFTMPNNDNDINMFVLGDIQAKDLTNIQTIIGTLRKDDYDLGIQTGDAVDFASSYSCWTEALDLMGNFTNNQVMLHTIGNHELTGENAEEITSAMYNLDNPSYYSMDYGLVYVATISHKSSMNEYEKALQWLVKDAAKSDAPYKILVMHQPAYYTNASDPSNAELHKLLPAYVEQAGIDIVFAGHDHSYARTEEINDVVYYICGTSGEKAYPITENEEFNFKIATDDFTAIYITLKATDNGITVTTYDLVNGVPAVIDTYTKSAN